MALYLRKYLYLFCLLAAESKMPFYKVSCQRRDPIYAKWLTNKNQKLSTF